MIPVRQELWADLDSATPRHVLVFDLEPPWKAAAELLTNGDLEDWTAGAPDSWIEDETGGTITEETADPHSPGTSAAKLSRNADAGGLSIIQSGITGLTPGKWYLLEFNQRGSVARAAASSLAQFKVKNVTAVESVAAEATGYSSTWSAGDSQRPVDTPATWGVTRFWFQTKSTFGVDDSYLLGLYLTAGASNNGEDLYLDNIRVVGPFDGRGRYFSSKSVQWGEQQYDRLALESTEIREELGEVVPETEVTFANVGKELMSLITPTDLITSGRMAIRVVFMDAADNLKPQNIVLFYGGMETPRLASDRRMEVRVAGLLDGFGVRIPRRPLSIWCGAVFADGVDCRYTQTTTTTNSGTSSTGPINVASSTKIFVGETVRVGKDGAEVTVATVGAGTFTVDTAISWASSDPVIYTDCSRNFAEPSGCQAREREDDFLGILGVHNAARQNYWRANFKSKDDPAPEIA